MAFMIFVEGGGHGNTLKAVLLAENNNER